MVLTGRASYVTWVPKPEDVALGIEALERVGIIHLRERPYTELSGGEQQLVRIARVLAQQPRLILLDEPSSHLDFLNQAHLLQLIRELVDADLTVLAVLHDPNSAFLYGDHFVFLKDGSVERLPGGRAPLGQGLSGADLRHRNGFDPLRRPRPCGAQGVTAAEGEKNA